ncbi:MAG: hypothetical protein WCH78_14595 [Bacteroidota bacterium]
MGTKLIEKVSIEKIDNATKIKLLEVAQENGQVIMHCKHYGCSSECGRTEFCELILHPDIELIPTNGSKPAELLHAYNINLAPAKNFKKSYSTQFTLVFSTLPKHCTEFDFIEPDVTGNGWVSKNIKRNKSDVYKLHITRDVIWEGDVDF